MAVDRRTVGLHTGSRMPSVGLGTWKSEKSKVGDAVTTAIDAGYRHFDCAAIYGNEAEVGEALERAVRTGAAERGELFVTTKLWNSEHQKARVKPALEKSLKLLQLDYVDLYLMHWPIALNADNSFNTDTHFLEAWQAMEELVDCGLARHIGLSNFNQQQVSEVLSVARIRPAALQVECHPYLTQPDLVDFCLRNDIQVTAYCPLARGPFPRPDRPGNLLEHHTVCSVAQAHGATPAQVLVRFQVERGITVIPKSVTDERIRENIKVFHFSLSDNELAALQAINQAWRVLTNERDQDHPLFPFPPTSKP